MKFFTIINTIFLFLITISSSILLGQGQINKEFNVTGTDEVRIQCEYGNVEIKLWDKNTVQLSGIVIVNGKSEVDAFDIRSKKRGNIYTITTEMDFSNVEKKITVIDKNGNKTIYTPEAYEKLDRNDGHYSMNIGFDTDIKITFWIPRDMILDLESTYGNIAISEVTPNGLNIENTYGNVDATFAATSKLPDFKMISTYGAVDLTIKKSLKADIEMHTSYGKIMTNLDLEIEHQRACSNGFGEDIKSQLNGGGTDIVLEATYGSVYLRGDQ